MLHALASLDAGGGGGARLAAAAAAAFVGQVGRLILSLSLSLSLSRLRGRFISPIVVMSWPQSIRESLRCRVLHSPSAFIIMILILILILILIIIIIVIIIN